LTLFQINIEAVEKHIALFFGSFNPIHIGHLIIAECVAQSGFANQVWFIVSPHNPHKKATELLHAFDRYDMVERAIADNHKFKVSDVEFHLPKPNYTIHTLEKLHELYPAYHFRLVMGEDNLNSLPKWKNFEQILNRYGLLIYPRPGQTTSELALHNNVHFIKAPLLDISASYIRQQIKAGKSIRYMVPEPVEQLISLKKFYI
jgi:nicotinate-nucleotide adenylyltransferase